VDGSDNTDRVLAESEVDLQDLEGRLDKFRKPQDSSNRRFAQGVALVASLGFVLAGCLIAGILLGDYLWQQTGFRGFQLIGALFGLITAFFAGGKLMKPLMKSDD